MGIDGDFDRLTGLLSITAFFALSLSLSPSLSVGGARNGFTTSLLRVSLSLLLLPLVINHVIFVGGVFTSIKSGLIIERRRARSLMGGRSPTCMDGVLGYEVHFQGGEGNIWLDF